MTQTTLTLQLSDQATATLARRHAQTGQDLAAVASDLIEQAIARPSVEEALAPFRNQVAASAMTDTEIDTLLAGELEAHRREKKVNPS